MSEKGFRGSTQQPVDFSPLEYVCGDTKKTLVYSDPIKNPFVLTICVAVEPFQPLKLCRSQWSDASMYALIQVEDILNICCENCDVINGKNRTLLNWEHVKLLYHIYVKYSLTFMKSCIVI
jgi:hypothetical protein